MVSMRLVSLLAFITLSTAAGSATAQSALVDHAAIPRPLERANPRYPRAAFRQRIEGSVLVVFSVAADGHVVEPRVLDSTPPGVFERAALDAVSAWTYEALGVETKGMKVRLTFRRRGDARPQPAPPSSAIVRGVASPPGVARDSVAQHIPAPALDPESR